MVKRPQPSREPEAAAKAFRLEWVFAVLGAVVTATMLAVIVWEALQPARPADLTAAVERVRTTRSGVAAEVVVRNSGGAPASEVHVEGRVGVSSASAVAAYVPSGGETRVFVAFEGASAGSPAKVWVSGYAEP